MRALCLVPDYAGSPGGIALHARIVAQALSECSVHTTIVALHDTGSDTPGGASLYVPCRGRRALFLLHAVAALRSRPHVILVDHANFSAVGWILARLVGARLVIFLHGIEVWEPLPRLRRFGLRHADVWIAVSGHTADRAAATNELRRDSITILPLCLMEVPRSVAIWSLTSRSILTVSRISAAEGYKGHDRVIRAMPALLGDFPDLMYHVVGDGDGRAGLEALARDVGVTEAVRFHGIVSAADVSRFYAEASVFVMPSSGEGFGFVFLEAMAHGLPIVAGNADATPEVVADGETGLLVDPSSVDAVVTATGALLSDDALRRRMGLAGHRRVTHEFSYALFSHRLRHILELAPIADGASDS